MEKTQKTSKKMGTNKSPAITGGFELTLLCGDAHSYYARLDVIKAMLEQAKQVGPHETLFGGDLYNLDAYRNGASETDKTKSTKKDREMASEVFGMIDPDIILDGNHEWRILNLKRSCWTADRDAGELMDKHYNGLVSSRKRIRLPYHKRSGVYKIGNYGIQHGGYFGNLQKTLNEYGNTIQFHVHAFQSLKGGSPAGPRHLHTVGSLCRVDMEYNEKDGSSLGQENGWAWLVKNKRTAKCAFVPVTNLGGVWTPIGFNL